MWHYSLNGVSYGPISEVELDALVQSGQLPADTFVWCETMNEWQPYDTVRTVAPPPPPTPPPLPPLPAAAPAKPAMRLHIAHAAPAAASGPPEINEYAEQSTEAYATPEPPPNRQKLEAFTAWGTVAVVLVAMFVFVALVLGRPRNQSPAANTANTTSTSPATTTTSANNPSATTPRTPSRTRLAGFERLQARVLLKGSTLTIYNQSNFDWPATTIEFDNSDGHYSYRMRGLSRTGTFSVSLRDFQQANGKSFGFFSSKPTDLKLILEGMGTSLVHLSRQ